MPVKLDELQNDQEVVGSDGQRIGRVGAFLVDPATGMRYIKVDWLILRGLAAEGLFIPQDAIAEGEIGKPVVLTVSAEEAEARFSKHPVDIS